MYWGDRNTQKNLGAIFPYRHTPRAYLDPRNSRFEDWVRLSQSCLFKNIIPDDILRLSQRTDTQ